ARRDAVNEFVQSVHIGFAAGHNDVRMRAAPGVDVVAAPDADGHVGHRVYALRHRLDAELNQFVLHVDDPVDGAIDRIHWPCAVTGVDQVAALRVADTDGRCGDQLIAAGDLHVPQFVGLLHRTRLVRHDHL